MASDSVVVNKPGRGGLEALLSRADWPADQQGPRRACCVPGVASARLARPPSRVCRLLNFEKRPKEAQFSLLLCSSERTVSESLWLVCASSCRVYAADAEPWNMPVGHRPVLPHRHVRPHHPYDASNLWQAGGKSLMSPP